MHCADGTTKVLKESLALQEGEVIDASRYIFSSRQLVQLGHYLLSLNF